MDSFPMTNIQIRLTCFILGSLFFSPAYSQETGKVPIEIIALTDQRVPDHAEDFFERFGNVVVSSTGTVCIFGETDEPNTTDRGIWSNYHGSLVTVVKEGDALANPVEEMFVSLPGGIGGTSIFCDDQGAVYFEGESDIGLEILACATDRANIKLKVSNDGSFAKQEAFEEINSPIFSNSGHIAFHNRIGGAVEQVWKRSPDGAIELVASTDSPAPGQPGRFFTGFGNYRMNALGDLAFFTTAANPADPFEDSANGIWSDTGGDLHLVVASDSALPDMPSNAKSTVQEFHWMNDRGEIAFGAFWEADTSPSQFGKGIYVSNPSGQIRKAVDSESSVEAILLNNGILYYSLIEDGVRTINREGQRIVEEQQSAPRPPGSFENIRITFISDWTVNNRGTVFFFAVLEGDQVNTENNQALFSVPKGGEPIQFLRTGDILEVASGDTRTIRSLFRRLGARGQERTISEFGQISGVVEFSDFSTAVILAGTKEIDLVVNTEDDQDDGVCNLLHCSLREAINAANARKGADMIVFDIPSDASPYTIQPESPLPSITDIIEIDGNSQKEEFSGRDPIIEIDGGKAGPLSGVEFGGGVGQQHHPRVGDREFRGKRNPC